MAQRSYLYRRKSLRVSQWSTLILATAMGFWFYDAIKQNQNANVVAGMLFALTANILRGYLGFEATEIDNNRLQEIVGRGNYSHFFPDFPNLLVSHQRTMFIGLVMGIGLGKLFATNTLENITDYAVYTSTVVSIIFAFNYFTDRADKNFEATPIMGPRHQ